MSILMAGLQETQMRTVYQVAMGNELPSYVTTEDLISIITFLFKQLDWIDKGSSSQPSSQTRVESPILVDMQKNKNQAQENSVKQLTLSPDLNENKPSKGDGYEDPNVEIAEESTQADQNVEQNQDTQVENADLLVHLENYSGDYTLKSDGKLTRRLQQPGFWMFFV